MDWLIWLIIAIIFIIIECFTTQLISIWFAIGALIALLLSCLHLSLMCQLIAFIVSGLVLAGCFYPVIKKHLRSTLKDNDEIVGKVAIVEQDFVNDEGRVYIDHMDWKAQSIESLQKGDKVIVTALHGVTVTVAKEREDNDECLYY